MRHCFLNRKSLAAATVFALALALPAIAAQLSLGAWQEFGFTNVDTPAAGCDPADPAGAFCTSSSATAAALLGGKGLIVLADGITPDPDGFDPTPFANVRSVKGRDAIKAYEQRGIRALISPLDKITPDVAAGRALFIAANCRQCHDGAQWTGVVRFPSPADPSQTANGQIVSGLRKVGTFDAAAPKEIRQNDASPLGASSPADVIGNVQHRSAGTAGVDTLANPSDRAKLVQYVLSIDAAAVPIPPQ